MNKFTRVLLRLWISLMSVGTFAAGWVMLSHAQKPAPFNPAPQAEMASITSVDMPALAPVPSLEELLSSGQTMSQPVFIRALPRLRTRGS